jgi:hypothetical protein
VSPSAAGRRSALYSTRNTAALAGQLPGIEIPRSPLCLFEMIESKPMQLIALLGADFCDSGL